MQAAASNLGNLAVTPTIIFYVSLTVGSGLFLQHSNHRYHSFADAQATLSGV